MTQFALANPYLTAFVVCFAIYAVFMITNRFFRSRNIKNSGWPTNPNMDADGDLSTFWKSKSDD